MKYWQLTLLIILFISCNKNKQTGNASMEKNHILEKDSNRNDSNNDTPVQEEADKNYHAIMDSFNEKETPTLSKVKDYPDYYGGSYINENGQLVVFITGDTIKAKEIIGKYVDNKNILFVNSEYSYKTLNKIMDRIDEAARKKSPVFQHLDSWYIRETENRIHINLNRYEDSVINEFKEKVIDSPAIIFKRSPGKIIFD